MKDTVFIVAHSLYEKNIAFCIYRQPSEATYRIASDHQFFAHQTEKSFIFRPFTSGSKAIPLELKVLDTASFSSSFVENVINLPDRTSFPDIPLPGNTSEIEYKEAIASYLTEIRAGKLEKAILSRVIRVPLPEKFDLFTTFESMSERYPDAFVYLFSHSESGIWLGATPELLLRQNDNKAEVMALAGTQQKNREGQYQWRDKEMVEHELVGKHIQSVFSKLHHSEVTKNGPYTVTSGKVAHLRTDFTFKVNTAGQIEKLLTELHPTPAIGGLPVTEGLECISKYEGYDRTYYCGILGETNFDTFANLYVNLRCMKISQGEAAIFVGGGITSSSDPDEEWQETVIKSKTMMDILHPPK